MHQPYYKDDLTGEQHDGSADGKSGLAVVQSSGPINSWALNQRWLIGAAPTSTICAGEVINATLKITVTNN